jgi:hypothetical protein
MLTSEWSGLFGGTPHDKVSTQVSKERLLRDKDRLEAICFHVEDDSLTINSG